MDNDAPIPANPDRPPPSATLEMLLHGEILPPKLRALVEGPVSRAVAEAADYAKGALSAATRRAYLADWTDFDAWCRAGGAEPLPVSPIVVAGYLASLAKTLGRSGLKRRQARRGTHLRRDQGPAGDLHQQPRRHPRYRPVPGGLCRRAPPLRISGD